MGRLTTRLQLVVQLIVLFSNLEHQSPSYCCFGSIELGNVLQPFHLQIEDSDCVFTFQKHAENIPTQM